jgi:hypothetical protein
VEKLGTRSGAERVQTLAESALQLVGRVAAGYAVEARYSRASPEPKIVPA